MTAWLWRIRVTVPAASEDSFAETLRRFSAHAVAAADAAARSWTVDGFGEAEPDRAAVMAAVRETARALGLAPPPLSIDPLPAGDWLADNLRSFAPLRLGRYFVHGTHREERPPPGATALAVDAGPAFGSGAHGSTAGCLLALDALARRARVRRALDVGTGSGILALAVAGTWRAPVFACDTDGDAVAAARRNARRNGLAALVRAERSDGLRCRPVLRRRPYDLIVANVLLGPLVRNARDLRRALAPQGAMVLAGVVAAEGNRLLAPYRSLGLRLGRRLTVDGWQTLVLRRGGCRR
jgi:ribosomal protein L11 methyltransferase